MKKNYLLVLAIFGCTLLYSQAIRYINTENLNIRSGPGKNHPVVDTAPLGNSVTVISQSGNWSQIETEDGVKGYASSKFLSDNKTSPVKDDKEPTPTWQLIALVIAFVLSYKFFGGKKNNSATAKPSSGQTSKPVRSSSVTPHTYGHKDNTKIAKVKDPHYFCKFCGSENQRLSALTFGRCSKNSSGHHIPFEGSIADKYLCKFCGREDKRLSALTFGKCGKSPNNYHQPFEGGAKKSYSCKFCGRPDKSLSTLTFGKCSNSTNGYHQPLI